MVSIDDEPMHRLRLENVEIKIELMQNVRTRIEDALHALLSTDSEAKKKYDERQAAREFYAD